jgi:peptidoglycan lytic transglycosylase G
LRLILKLLLLLSLVLAALIGSIAWWANAPLQMRETTVDFRIVPGSSLRSAVAQMQEAGIAVNPDLLAILARWRGVASGIKAGSYSIGHQLTPEELLAKLVRGDVTQGEVVLVDGLTFRQWRVRLDQHPDLKHETQGLDEAEIAARLGIDGGSVEGWLFPDTYLFDKHSSDLEVLARAHRAMRKRLDTAWAGRDASLPYRNPYEALIMASIIEKETGRNDDRAHIAAVFVNRLRKGMPLQTDPTVIYGMAEKFDGNLRKRDLQTDTPYNTYTRAGLPPSPIAMPSMAALQAALHPADGDALYFVARGDGSSQFSRTLDEHNRAVNKYQRGNK